MGTNEKYYDIEELIKNVSVDEAFYVQDLKRRKLFMCCEIDECTVSDITRHIMQFNADDYGKPKEERTPILLYLTSVGGDVDAGFSLIDVIEASTTPVYIINTSYQYSMGFLIGLAGHKRFATKNAKFLMHDGTYFSFDSGSKAQDRMEFQKRVEGRIKDYVIAHSKVTSELYDSKARVEWYTFADEAQELGFTDYIIGKDCTIDDIVCN